jgi:hypothetical protein
VFVLAGAQRRSGHRGNADVVRQDLLAERWLKVSPRTLQRAVQPYRMALKAEALATVRFETPPGRQLQIDFGENVLLLGPPSVSKKHLAVALGREAVALAGHTVQFTTAMTLVVMLAKAHADKRLDEKLLVLSKPKLLIVDELG